MSHNIANLSEQEKHDIELMRQASLLIHDMKIRRKSRADIEREISKLDESDQDKFRQYLNMYRSGRIC